MLNNSFTGIERLYSLQHLDLSKNLISDIHETNHLGGLPCLESVKLADNPIVTSSSAVPPTPSIDNGTIKKWSIKKYRVYVLSRFGERYTEVRFN